MVKIKACVLMALAVLLSCCTARQDGYLLHPETLLIEARPSGRFLSLAVAGTNLLAVFSDRETTTLKLMTIPLGPHLPSEAPTAEIVDKVDVSPPLSPTFGAHMLTVRGNAVDILYLCRGSDDRSILKLASRSLEARQWNLDVLEPPGEPLAALPDEKGAVSVFWAAGSLLSRVLPGASVVSTLRSTFQLSGQASVFGEDGFTVYDAASRSLLVVKRSESGYLSREFPGASAVQSSLLSPDGLLAVLTWDAPTRRLSLLEQKPDTEKVSRTTVTLSEGTGKVALLSSPVRSMYVFLFDEQRQTGGIRAQYQLSVIAPGTFLGAFGARYRKGTLLSGPEPVEGFAAVEAPDALYVLALQGGLKLLRVALAR